VAVRAPEAYRRILVPVSIAVPSDEAMAIACRLSAERGATVAILGVVEVPAELPLDAQMQAEDEATRRALAEARAVAELYGVAASTRVVRARAAAEAIVAQAEQSTAQLIVLGAPRRRTNRRGPIFGRTVAAVLGQAPCRVMVAAR
jgi:nucleotide-binding universal stress UspA family protein